MSNPVATQFCYSITNTIIIRQDVEVFADSEEEALEKAEALAHQHACSHPIPDDVKAEVTWTDQPDEEEMF